MEIAHIAGYVVEYDREATQAAYAQFSVPEPENCGCWYCQNWVAGRDDLVNDDVRQLLDRFGIPLKGEIEVWEITKGPNSHSYGGWYFVVGRLLERPVVEQNEFAVGSWVMNWSVGESYSMPQFAGKPVIELQFFIEEVPSFLSEALLT